MDYNKIVIVRPSFEYIEAINNFKNTLVENGIKGASMLYFNSADDWIRKCEELGTEDICKDNKDIVINFIALDLNKNKIIAIIKYKPYNLDLESNQFDSNIEYSIIESERNKGYETFILKYLINFSKFYTINELRVVCNIEDKTMKNAINEVGGKFGYTCTNSKTNEVYEIYFIKV